MIAVVELTGMYRFLFQSHPQLMLEFGAMTALLVPGDELPAVARRPPDGNPLQARHRMNDKLSHDAQRPMIEVRNLVKNHGPLRVLDGVSLSVRRGEVAAIIGPSGGGKSTLLRCINGLETFDAGEVASRRAPAASPAPPRRDAGDTLRELRRRVGMVFQQFNLFPHMNVLENVLAGPLYVLGRSRDECEAEARELLGPRRPRRKAHRQSRPTLRRPAAARRHRPHAGDEARSDPVRRTDQRPRPADGRRSDRA